MQVDGWTPGLDFYKDYMSAMPSDAAAAATAAERGRPTVPVAGVPDDGTDELPAPDDPPLLKGILTPEPAVLPAPLTTEAVALATETLQWLRQCLPGDAIPAHRPLAVRLLEVLLTMPLQVCRRNRQL